MSEPAIATTVSPGLLALPAQAEAVTMNKAPMIVLETTESNRLRSRAP